MKKILYIVIFLLIAIIITNKIAKKFLNQTKIEKVDFIDNIKLIYGADYKDYIEVYKQQSSPVIYSPLTEFRESPKNQSFVSVSEIGNRCNEINIPKCHSAKGGENEIWIFGGSTVFGYGLKNNETIAAHLDKLIIDKKVVNFGQGYFNSTQSRIFFQNLLTYLPKPHSVIFMEGFNEFKINQINNYEFPIKTALTKSYDSIINKKKDSTNEKIINWLKERFIRLNIVKLIKEKFTNVNKDNVLNYDPTKNLDHAYVALINRLRTNFKINKSIGENFKIQILNIMEPISLSRDNYLSSNLPKSYFRNFDKHIFHHKKIYKLIENNFDLLNLVDLNLVNLYSSEKMFIDLTHYSKNFSKEIALKIYNNLQM